MQLIILSSEVKHVLGCFLVFILLISKSYSQVVTPSNLKEEVTVPKIEKIYLHTDRNYYVKGESLWYKAYSVYAYNNLLFNYSNVLYVELISPEAKIIARNTINLEEGIGNGDFKLTDSIGVKKAGIYQLRAYTNWSRNFKNDFVFQKEIEIIDIFQNQSEIINKPVKITSIQKTSDQKTFEERQKTFKINFFPEGGSLLENVSSILAFKSVDEYGNPIMVKGEVFDMQDNLVTRFSTIHEGMGKFYFTPLSGKQYYAKIKFLNGEELRQKLPKANKEGYVLSCKEVNGRSIVSIKTNKETFLKNTGETLTINCRTRGISYLKMTPVLTKPFLSFELPKTDIPDGISQITLYDSKSRPQSERLIYIEKKHDLNVNVSTNKKVYKPNEKVILNISSKSKNGQAKSASFSLSVADMNGMAEEKNLDTNISSYFLLESDIRGKVHHPGYYFDSNNSMRLVHLDILLLTQGWRDFLWKTIPKTKDSFSYKVEKGINVSGKVKQLFGNKPKANSNVTLTLFNKGKKSIANSITDSLGKFKFENLFFKGSATMLLNVINEKGKNSGMFILDSTYLPPMYVNFKKGSVINQQQKEIIKETIGEKQMMFGIKAENVLDEVVLTGNKKDNVSSLYGLPDNNYVADDEIQKFQDIFQLIEYKIPFVTTTNGIVGFTRFNGQPAHIVIDGIHREQEDLQNINIDDIEKIEAFKISAVAIFGLRASNGALVIYLKKGSKKSNEKKVFHSITTEIEGFYDARIFYSPNLENLSTEMDTAMTIRNTLYWNPYIHPDQTGISQVSYYNSKVETKAKVTIEGMTETGIPVVKHTYYKIEK